MTYGVIYADPPWNFKTYSDKGLGRSASAWYETLSLDEIKELPVANLAAPDCVLLMWVTDPHLRNGFDVIDAWGFQFKTVGFYWAKTTQDTMPHYMHNDSFPIGTGYWTRANPEQCLLATRGHPKRINADVRKLIIAPRREHSRKPDETYERIERLCSGPYVELFARNTRPGWDTMISNEAETGPNMVRRWNSRSGPSRISSHDIDL